MEVEAQLGGEGVGVGAEAVVMTALLEGDRQQVSNGAAKGLPTHLHIAISRDGHGGGLGGFSQGTTQRPATQHIPIGDFGDALELHQLVFSSLGEFDAIDGGLHG